MARARPRLPSASAWLPLGLAGLLAALVALPLALLQPQPVAASGPRALQMEQAQAIETLRLRVPAAARPCWLQTEASSWEPWLAQQRGYRGRQLFWDRERQEGVLLIGWATRSDWKAIPAASLDRMQKRFETAARQCLAADDPGSGQPASRGEPSNPFPIVSSAELVPERLEEPAASELP
ncbi:MAG: TIGR03792 family protein [Prochlorococcaceae cyanobacterium]